MTEVRHRKDISRLCAVPCSLSSSSRVERLVIIFCQYRSRIQNQCWWLVTKSSKTGFELTAQRAKSNFQINILISIQRRIISVKKCTGTRICKEPSLQVYIEMKNLYINLYRISLQIYIEIKNFSTGS